MRSIASRRTRSRKRTRRRLGRPEAVWGARMSEAPLDPMRAAKAHMRQPLVGRFYRIAEAREGEGGRHALTVDGRVARTPGRNALTAASGELMARVVEEWRRQGET